MGNKDNFDSDSSSESERTSPPKRQKIDKESSSSKREFVKQPIYNIKQIDDIAFGKRSTLFGVFGSAPRLSSTQAKAVKEAKKLAMSESIKIVLMKQSAAHQQQNILNQRTQIQRQQALALMCRVYVGSISFELKEETIRAAFLPFGPIKTINMSWDPATQKHKGFAFVEYEIPEGAQLALEQMNGAMLGGRNIKVGRPSNMPQAQQVIDEIQEEAKSYNRIYISSIHPELTEEDIKSVFEAFGGITFCKLADGSAPGKHKGYGFIEYSTNPSALEAIASMNMFDLGGQLLRVGRSITPPNLTSPPRESNSRLPTAAAIAAAAATAKIQALDALQAHVLNTATSGALKSLPSSVISSLIKPTSPPSILPTSVILQPTIIQTPSAITSTNVSLSSEELLKQKQEELQKKLMDESESTLQQQESMSIKGQNARHLVMRRLMRNQESKVVILRNMVGPEDVDESLQEEIQDECSKFGVVEKVIIYKEKQTDNDDEDDYGDVIVKIFVEFSMSSEADKASSALNGRFFGGRLVKAESYDQALFDHNDFSG